MAHPKVGLPVYTVVRVWRGIAAGARNFLDLREAQRHARRLRLRNPQDDDVQLFEDTLPVPSRGRRVTDDPKVPKRAR
jgi:hypothetical protein